VNGGPSAVAVKPSGNGGAPGANGNGGAPGANGNGGAPGANGNGGAPASGGDSPSAERLPGFPPLWQEDDESWPPITLGPEDDEGPVP
jgi:hypothetical protein